MVALNDDLVCCVCKICNGGDFLLVDSDELKEYRNSKSRMGHFPSLDPLEAIYIVHDICPTCYVKRYLNLGKRSTNPLHV